MLGKYHVSYVFKFTVHYGDAQHKKGMLQNIGILETKKNARERNKLCMFKQF